jgi:MFS family permease
MGTPDLRRLQSAWAAASVGGWAFMVALAVHAYAVGGTAAVGLAALVRMVPAGLGAPLLGLAADRFPRRDVLLASTIARTAMLGAIAACVAAGAPFALILVLGALFTVASAAHKPAHAALIPHLAPDPAAANALATSIDNAAFIAGAAAAGVLVAALGATTAFGAAGATLAVAAILVARITRDLKRPGPFRFARRETGRGELIGPGPFRFEAFEGLRVVARDRRLRLLVGVLSASTLVEGMVDVLVVVTALQVVDLGSAGVGWLNAAWGVGGLAGGAVALSLVGRGRLGIALPAGGLLIGVPLVALAWLPLPVAALVLLSVLGIGYSLVEVAGVTLLQRLAQDRVRARAFAVVEGSYWLTTGAGAMLAPLAVTLAGPRGALAVIGAALPLIVLSRWAALTSLAPRPLAIRVAAQHARV